MPDVGVEDRGGGVSDLAEFLLARIAEDEDVVRHCLEAVDADRTEYAQQLARRTGPLSTTTSASHCGQDMGPRGTVEATPGRVLAECEAKRRIVEEHSPLDLRSLYGKEGAYCPRCVDLGTDWEYIEGACPTLRALALPYADHVGYRQESKP